MNERSRLSLEEVLAAARARYDRLTPSQAWQALQHGDLLVDVRPLEQRQRDGEVPGAVVVCRNVLEWRLEPGGPARMPEAAGPEQRVIVLCNEGYSTQLAVVSLLALGLDRATDVIGGMQAWLAEQLPTAPSGTCIDRTALPPGAGRRSW